jgi:hypothetical protein
MNELNSAKSTTLCLRRGPAIGLGLPVFLVYPLVFLIFNR